MINLEGKVALVTGAASKHSIGRAVAMRLAMTGADVVVTDKYMVPTTIRDEDREWGGMIQIVADIEKLSRRGIAVEADISSMADCRRIITETMKTFGRIDYFINAAGLRGPSPVDIVNLDESAWRLVIDVNMTGPFLLAKVVVAEMLKNPEGRKIIFFASQAGVEGTPGMSAYGAAKHGLLGMMKSLALEVAPFGINVNAISPMAFDTNFRDAAVAEMAKKKGIPIDKAREMDAEMGNQRGPMIPIGRHGTPDDAAGMVEFLISDDASYITAQNILMNGGHKSL